MNAVEIEEAVSELVIQPFDAAEFPFQFLKAFDAKDTTLKRLRKGDSNQSDVGGVLWRSNIHIAIADPGAVGDRLAQLRASPKTAIAKAKFILATDGEMVEAEDLVGGDVIACPWADLPRHFAIFLPLAGISTVKEIKNNPIDVKATGRLNKLYVELLKDNPDWATEERRHELNQFMARLIFCFFAEDTGIFRENQFTATITQMSHAGHGSGDEQWGNTHEVLTELFRAMDTPVTHEGNLDDRYRRAANIRPYADVFPYVNGGLFTGATESPRFSRTARAFLLRAGDLDWREINPDIFGSMIQAVADDGERGELGMHYTSVPNILKVLNPLFLDDLREQLSAAGDSRQKLRNLRRRLAGIRVFDPACGSGNFLVIAYKEMRAIEAQIVAQLGGEESLKLADRRSVIPLSNFYGIEIKGFAAEIARLALLIAEFQADCLYLSQQEARAMVLPLHKTGQIIAGNALLLDWQEVCPPVQTLTSDESAKEENASIELYICGNPPYLGSRRQEGEHKKELQAVVSGREPKWKSLDYTTGWIFKAADYAKEMPCSSAFVSTSSLCEGLHVSLLWPHIIRENYDIQFAYRPFKWANLAQNNAGVSVVIVGLGKVKENRNKIILDGENAKYVDNINPYLLDAPTVYVNTSPTNRSGSGKMLTGAMPRDGGNLILSGDEFEAVTSKHAGAKKFIKRYVGSEELINGSIRYCIWVDGENHDAAREIPEFNRRFEAVTTNRLESPLESTRDFANKPYRFVYLADQSRRMTIAVGAVSSEQRPYLPVDALSPDIICSNRVYALYDGDLIYFAMLSSKMHLAWVATICGRLEQRISYSNTLGWNTFPVPRLTAQDKADLTGSAENILLAREAHFPATIADLYDPDAMPDDLRRAHDENDEVLERIYIGRRFRNDTERLEKLFDLYTKMTANATPKGKAPKKGKQAA